MAAYEGMQVKLHACMTCALGGGEGVLCDRGISDLHWPLRRVLGGWVSERV